VTANGTVTGTNGVGILAKSYSTNYGATVTVNSGATVKGAGEGIYAVTGSQSIGITNNGTVQNFSGATSAVAIRTQSTGGPTRLNNYGTITGSVQLVDAGANTFNNGGTGGTGTWNTAGGVNAFGLSGTFTNAANGTVVAANSGATLPVTTAFGGLTTFTNAGQITMHNGLVGDEMIISGNFVGQAGRSRSTPFSTTAHPPPIDW
jgi:autotransporter family porin